MKRIFTSLSVIVLALIIAGCEGIALDLELGVRFTCNAWAFNMDGSGSFYIPEEYPSEPETGYVLLQVTDGNGTTLYSHTFENEDDSIEFFESIGDNDSIAYNVLPDANPITLSMYAVLDGDNLLFFEASGSCNGLGTSADANIVYPPDNRINWQYGDLEVVVYSHEEGTVVYCYRDSAWLAMLINQAVIDAAPAGQAQDVPVLESADCNAAFYILDSGEYQINIWTHEGKIYELISDNLDFTNARKRYYDPNE